MELLRLVNNCLTGSAFSDNNVMHTNKILKIKKKVYLYIEKISVTEKYWQQKYNRWVLIDGFWTSNISASSPGWKDCLKIEP